MTRTLLAFGDSHTAGSEIDEKYSLKCHSKAYPAYIAKYYKLDYKNYAQTGGSNDWALLQFNKVIKSAIKNKKEVFVLFNFLEPARTFFYNKESELEVDQIMHCHPSMMEKNYIEQISKRFKEKSEEEYLQYLDWLYNFYTKDYEKIMPLYRNYLKKYSIKLFDIKAIKQINYVQNICKQNNIPFIFHTSCLWYGGDWTSISKENFYGHDKESYSGNNCIRKGHMYSFWGRATKHPRWKHLQEEYRWSEHYPEEYHRYYASLLINFINEQKILEGYI
jgi:hypothetical protein